MFTDLPENAAHSRGPLLAIVAGMLRSLSLPLLVAVGVTLTGRPALAADAGETDAVSETAAGRSGARVNAGAGVHWLWAQGKAMPGITLRLGGRWLAGEVEGGLIWLTERDPDRDRRFLGGQLGAHLAVTPISNQRVRLGGGLGADLYPLFNIHGDEWQFAMALRARGDVRIARKVWLFGTARAYPLQSDGLELGVGRDRSHGLPVLFGTGIEWSTE